MVINIMTKTTSKKKKKHGFVMCLSNNTHKYSRCGRPEKASSLIVVKELAFSNL